MRINEGLIEVTEEEARQLEHSDFAVGASIFFSTDDGDYTITKNENDFIVEISNIIPKKYWKNNALSINKFFEIQKLIIEYLGSKQLLSLNVSLEDEDGYFVNVIEYRIEIRKINEIISLNSKLLSKINSITDEISDKVSFAIDEYLKKIMS